MFKINEFQNREERRSDTLLKYKIKQMTFYLNMIYQDEQDNEEKATLDDDIIPFSAALISCHNFSLTCVVYNRYSNSK